jgi:hypothetical protein
MYSNNAFSGKAVFFFSTFSPSGNLDKAADNPDEAVKSPEEGANGVDEFSINSNVVLNTADEFWNAPDEERSCPGVSCPGVSCPGVAEPASCLVTLIDLSTSVDMVDAGCVDVFVCREIVGGGVMGGANRAPGTTDSLNGLKGVARAGGSGRSIDEPIKGWFRGDLPGVKAASAEAGMFPASLDQIDIPGAHLENRGTVRLMRSVR